MANHKSSEKRARSSEKKRVRNRQYLSSVRSAVKKFRLAVASNLESDTIQKLFAEAQSLLGKAASKGLLHKNNSARRISRLAQALKHQESTKSGATAKAAPVKRKSAQATAAKVKAAKAAKKSAASSIAKPAAKKSAAKKKK